MICAKPFRLVHTGKGIVGKMMLFCVYLYLKVGMYPKIWPLFTCVRPERTVRSIARNVDARSRANRGAALGSSGVSVACNVVIRVVSWASASRRRLPAPATSR